MTVTSIGDLAQSLQLRRDQARISSGLQDLARELSTGLRSDAATGGPGGFGPLPGIETSLRRLAADETVAREALVAAAIVRQSLHRVASDAEALSGTLLVALGAGQPQPVDAAAADARLAFGAAVGALNAQAGGRGLFAGVATDRPALAPAEDILAALMADLGGVATAADAAAEIDLWFAPGGGFETAGYLGAAEALDPVRLYDGGNAVPPPRADDPAITGVLRELAKAAVLDMGLLAGAEAERAELARNSAVGLVNAGGALTELRARQGAAEARLGASLDGLAAERSALEQARAELVGADPFETAARLRAAEDQLASLYTVTARLAALSLSDYLR